MDIDKAITDNEDAIEQAKANLDVVEREHAALCQQRIGDMENDKLTRDVSLAGAAVNQARQSIIALNQHAKRLTGDRETMKANEEQNKRQAVVEYRREHGDKARERLRTAIIEYKAIQTLVGGSAPLPVVEQQDVDKRRIELMRKINGPV